MYTLTVGKGTSQVGFYAVSKDFWTTLGVATGVSMVSNPHDPGLIGPGAWTTKPWVYTLAPLRTPNLFTITATAEDGVTKQVFVITVIQDLSHDATLTAFQMSIQSRLPTYSVTPTVSPGTVLVPGVKGGATSATFSAPATVDPDASVAFSGDNVNWRSAPYTVPLVVGSNPVWVRVTAQDGTTVNLYTGSIEVPVDGSTLTALVPSVGFLDPPFASNVYSYQLKIPNNVPTVAFNATKSVSTSTVGATGWSLNFVPSTAGVLPIVVTALAGTGGSQTYSVRLVNLGDEGMMGYVLVSATQQGMNYQAPPGGPASPNPGGLVTNAGQTIQVTVTANCTKYFEDFGTGGGASCAGFGSTTTVQLFLVPTGGGNTVVTPSMTTVAAGVLAYTVVVPVGTYRVEVGARSILINHVALFQVRTLRLARRFEGYLTSRLYRDCFLIGFCFGLVVHNGEIRSTPPRGPFRGPAAFLIVSNEKREFSALASSD